MNFRKLILPLCLLALANCGEKNKTESKHESREPIKSPEFKIDLPKIDIHAVDIENLFPAIDFEVLKSAGGKVDVVATTPKSEKQLKQTLPVVISCFDDELQAADSITKGLNLLVGSRMVIARDLGYCFENGKCLKNERPYAHYYCQSRNPVAQVTAVKSNIQRIALKSGQSTMDVVLTTPATGSKIKSALQIISCTDVLTNADEVQQTGISIDVGSSLLVFRDTSYIFRDGSNNRGEDPVFLVTCTAK